jgi:hypothetical protein
VDKSFLEDTLQGLLDGQTASRCGCGNFDLDLLGDNDFLGVRLNSVSNA